MTVEEIKSKALLYTERFMQNDFQVTNVEQNVCYSVKQWYLILKLAEVYYNLKKGIFTRKQAIEEQKNIFSYVEEHSQLFKE